MMYKLETSVLTKRYEEEPKVAEVKVYKFFRKILCFSGTSLFVLLLRFGSCTRHLYTYYIKKKLVFIDTEARKSLVMPGANCVIVCSLANSNST